MRPSYLDLFSSGELPERVELLQSLLGPCKVCPQHCGVDRLKGEQGACNSGLRPIVSWHGPHYGEEPPISGDNGAGNIFFGNCNLRCVYCQNHQISQNPHHERRHLVDGERLATIMLGLQSQGCHNINLVSPTHFVPQIVHALLKAAEKGLFLPVVYNTNGYESEETLRLLEGIVDVYLPDLKYADDAVARSYSGVGRYASTARAAIKEMFRQTGSNLTFDNHGLLIRGLIIRLLVLPNDIAEIEDSLRFISQELSPEVAVSLMSQYYPTHLVTRQDRYPLLLRRISAGEWARAVAALERYGLEHGWMQDWDEAAGHYQPDFDDRQNPFKGCQR